MPDYDGNETRPDPAPNPQDEVNPQEVAIAMGFLAAYLAHGPRDVKLIDIEAAARNITALDLRRAKEGLRIESVHDAHNDCWMWVIPGVKNWRSGPRKPEPYRRLRLLLKAWLHADAEDREDFHKIIALEDAEQAVIDYLNEARREAQSQDGCIGLQCPARF
jgi:hypothetical protein